MLQCEELIFWYSAYDDQAKAQAHLNLHYGFDITLDMLTGHGQCIDLVSQSTIGQYAYFQQVSDLTFKALKA